MYSSWPLREIILAFVIVLFFHPANILKRITNKRSFHVIYNTAKPIYSALMIKTKYNKRSQNSLFLFPKPKLSIMLKYKWTAVVILTILGKFSFLIVL